MESYATPKTIDGQLADEPNAKWVIHSDQKKIAFIISSNSVPIQNL